MERRKLELEIEIRIFYEKEKTDSFEFIAIEDLQRPLFKSTFLDVFFKI